LLKFAHFTFGIWLIIGKDRVNLRRRHIMDEGIYFIIISSMNNINIEKEVQTIVKEGYLDKQSRFWKSWRR